MKKNTRVTTGKVRLSYCHLFEPYSSYPDQPEKYSVTVLIPKSDTATLSKIKAAMEAAKADFQQRNPGVKIPPALSDTIYDGDGTRPKSGDEFAPECKGHYVMTVSCKKPPVLVYSDKQPITNTTELYSGCYGKVIMDFFVYNTRGNKGLSAGLCGVMKLEDGEPLSGAVVSDSDWDDEDIADFL